MAMFMTKQTRESLDSALGHSVALISKNNIKMSHEKLSNIILHIKKLKSVRYKHINA